MCKRIRRKHADRYTRIGGKEKRDRDAMNDDYAAAK